MASIKRHVVLLNQQAAGNGSWIELDSRYDESPLRLLQVYVTAGDTVKIQGTTVDIKGSHKDVVTATFATEDITDIKTFTASGSGDLLEGPWTYIRAVKTGTTGIAKVQGFV